MKIKELSTKGKKAGAVMQFTFSEYVDLISMATGMLERLQTSDTFGMVHSVGYYKSFLKKVVKMPDVFFGLIDESKAGRRNP